VRNKTPLSAEPPVDSSTHRGNVTNSSTARDLDLSKFPTPEIPGNRGLATKVLWYVVAGLFFQHSFALLPSWAKATLLRSFGASIGRGVVIKPGVTIKCPWFLKVGDHTWIGQGVWIDNPGSITVGADVCISQGAYLVTGNHDFKDSAFRFFSSPIDIGDRCWICAKAIIPPGSRIPPGTVVQIGKVWRGKSESKASIL